MPTSQVLNLFEGNTDTITLSITRQSTGSPETLADKTVEIVFKPSASVADGDASVTKLTSPDDVTVTDEAGGQARFMVPAAVVSEPGSTFWRCDILSEEGAVRRTAMYGAVVTENL